MNLTEFKAWLDGYMTDRPNPDAALIAEKARGIVADPMPYLLSSPTVFRDVPKPWPYTPPTIAPFLPYGPTVTCGQAGTDLSRITLWH